MVENKTSFTFSAKCYKPYCTCIVSQMTLFKCSNNTKYAPAHRQTFLETFKMVIIVRNVEKTEATEPAKHKICIPAKIFGRD